MADNLNVKWARAYGSKGIYVFGVRPGTRESYKSMKYGNRRRWGMTIDDAEIIANWKRWPNADVCIATGSDSKIFVLDQDTVEGHGPDRDGAASLAALEKIHGPLPPTQKVKTPTGGTHFYFRYPETGNIFNTDNQIGAGLDIRGEGGMVVAPPTVKIGKDGKPAGEYKWLNDIPMTQAPAWLLDLVIDKNINERIPGEAQATIEKVIRALEIIPNEPINPDDPDYNEKTKLSWEHWNTVGMATWASTGGHADGLKAFHTFSKKNTDKYNEADTDKKWNDKFAKTPPDQVGFGKLWYLAQEEYPGWLAVFDEEQAAAKLNAKYSAPDDPPDGAAQPDEVTEVAPAFSEEYLALLFTKHHVGKLRYVAAWGKWLMFDGTTWKFDETLKTYTMARIICRDAGNTLNKPSASKAIASAKTCNAVVTLARSDHRHAATVDQWDRDPWLLNTPGGVVDLRTGKMRKHRIDDYMTKITAVTPDANCPIPIWRKFMKAITTGELQAYIRRVLGYGLTGLTIEQCLFFLYGLGGNGKGVLMNTAAGIFHDYHKTANQETFVVTNNEQHPTELAMLRGARLVTVPETEAGKRWAESRVKTLTGGDAINARFMRQDFFEFMPQFKLVISGQHKPGLNSVNEAIRRRVNMLPFNVIVPEAERDKHLTEKLKVEWPGILAWMIEGCLEWQSIGLNPPKIVTDATEEYLKAEDRYGRWLDECCVRDVNGWTGSTALFESWKEWADQNREYVGTRTKFSSDIRDRGFKLQGRESGNGFLGVKVKPLW
jgi:putative DNA primase/helicase